MQVWKGQVCPYGCYLGFLHAKHIKFPCKDFFKGKNVLFDNIQIPKRQLIELP